MPITSQTRLTAIVCMAFFLSAFKSHAQVKFEVEGRVNGTILSKMPGTYIFLQKGKNENNYYTERTGVTINNGVTAGLVKDDKSQTIHFDNMLEVLNFMAFNGWEYVGTPDKSLLEDIKIDTQPYLFRRKP